MPDAAQEAYAAGLQQGESIMAGGVGSTRHAGAGGQYYLNGARRLADGLGRPADEIVRRITAFHRKRLDAVPDLARYPELRGARDLLDRRYRGMAEAGMSPELIALVESMTFWRDFGIQMEEGEHFYAICTRNQKRPSHRLDLDEKCRVVYAPETPDGPIHAKNVDDPLAFWKPKEIDTSPGPWPFSPLFYDGVGNGLHVDHVPPEIFPVDVLGLSRKHARTLDEAEDILVNYKQFWGSANVLVHDEHGDSLAFEKPTWTDVAVRGPNEKGINYINGMGAVDDGMARFVDKQREAYLTMTEQAEGTPERLYWEICRGKFRNMAGYIAQLSENPTLEGVNALMEKRDPSGPMCLTAQKSHPEEEYPGATLMMVLYVIDKKQSHVRQWRGDRPAYLDTPTVVQYD